MNYLPGRGERDSVHDKKKVGIRTKTRYQRSQIARRTPTIGENSHLLEAVGIHSFLPIDQVRLDRDCIPPEELSCSIVASHTPPSSAPDHYYRN